MPQSGHSTLLRRTEFRALWTLRHLLEHRKHQNATQLSNTQKQIRTQLLERLSNNPLTVKQLADRMFVPIDTILKEITALIQEQKIIEDKGGKLQINR